MSADGKPDSEKGAAGKETGTAREDTPVSFTGSGRGQAVPHHLGDLDEIPLPGLSPSHHIGKYQLLASIGRGGMARVYLARQVAALGFEKLLVLKTMHPHLAEQPYYRNMFIDEARVAARINDAHVVHVYELGMDGESPFLAMEYLAGESMNTVVRAALQRNRPLPPLYAARIVADAAAGLHAAHEVTDESGKSLELVHRDVSPGNLIVLYQGTTKLLDFGVAKARGRISETAVGEVKGKFSYMSPEQILGTELDRRSDIFGLGVVLWEALAMKRLFRAENEATKMRLILEGTPPEPSILRPAVPPELDRIALKALARKPEDRYQTAEAMRAELEKVLHGSDRSAGAMDVSRYMHDLFPERLRARNKLLETASEHSASDPLLDLGELGLDLEQSSSQSVTVHTPERGEILEMHRRLLAGVGRDDVGPKRTLLLAFILAILSVIVGTVYLTLFIAGENSSATPTRPRGATGTAAIPATFSPAGTGVPTGTATPMGAGSGP